MIPFTAFTFRQVAAGRNAGIRVIGAIIIIIFPVHLKSLHLKKCIIKWPTLTRLLSLSDGHLLGGFHLLHDKESLEWGDKWKDKILDGTKKAEFAIIVISENFFDREWTEKELNEFLNRQNRNGQKLILPILHNITAEQLKEKYPSVADIQGIPSDKYSCDQIALLFAKQLIKRLKSA